MKDFKILKDLVGFNTVGDYDNLGIMNYIKSYLEGKGFSVKLIGDDKKVCYATIKNEQNFCFIGHTDTVGYGPNFGSNPFELVRKGDYLYGLGVCDMKGGISCILDSLNYINFDKMNYGMTLVFTYDEEIDFEGIRYFMKSGLIVPKNVLVGEPTNNICDNGSKGILEYEVEFFGTKAHSSMPKDSANKRAIEFSKSLYDLEDYFKLRSCNEYEFPNTTINVGIINGGDKINGVSDYCKVCFDIRVTKDILEMDYCRRYINDLVKKYDGKCNIKCNLDIKPFYNSNSDMNKVYEDITNKKCGKFFGICEASFLEDKDAMILGPGPITAHEDKERISVDSYYKTREDYIKLIKYYCNK